MTLSRQWIAALGVAAMMMCAAACGGGNDSSGGGAARNPTDPRRVPTATVPAERSTPIAALLDAGQSGGASLPDSYLVQAGDTLGSIAANLGVNVEELTRANPNIDPRGLRIGQELRIPRPTPTATAVARGPATPTATVGRTVTPTPATGTAATPVRTATPGAGSTPTVTPAQATPARTPTPGSTPAGGGSTYTVESGDTACSIARRLGVSLTALAQANGVSVDGLSNLSIGQTLRVPPSTGDGPGC
jgi:LysM repeat protein